MARHLLPRGVQPGQPRHREHLRCDVLDCCGTARPVGGYGSDLLARKEKNLLPFFTGQYRVQWTFLGLCFIVVMMFAMTLAGLSGVLLNAVVIGFLVGTGCAWAEGVFAQVPAMFPNDLARSQVSSAASALSVGLSTRCFTPRRGWRPPPGYSVAAVTMIPIVLLSAWVFQPEIAKVAPAGFVGSTLEAPPCLRRRLTLIALEPADRRLPHA